MATTPTGAANGDAPRLPLFYNQLTPLSSATHADFGVKNRNSLDFTKGVHAVPLTVDEFAAAHRFFPVVFSASENPTPLALLGLKEGENLYLNDDGSWKAESYVPAYIRRYPFMLARTAPDSDDLSLCFDASSGEVGEEFGNKLFEDGNQSGVLQNVLQFCEEYEKSIARTKAFVDEITGAELLMDGEVAIQPPGQDKPNVYRGFRMVNEQKLKELRGDQARKLVSNGALALVYAHLLSMQIIREHFARANPDLLNKPSSAVETDGTVTG
ncbi:MAG: SapC family protein [Pacificimonas sp.]|jgi:hypothetical protein|nr:SapC family protein [Pacificimonas sp.]